MLAWLIHLNLYLIKEQGVIYQKNTKFLKERQFNDPARL